MSRNYGIMNVRTDLNGGKASARTLTRDTQRDLEFLSARPPLKRSQITQALFDILTVSVWIVLGLVGVFAIGGPVLAAGWMIFCN